MRIKYLTGLQLRYLIILCSGIAVLFLFITQKPHSRTTEQKKLLANNGNLFLNRPPNRSIDRKSKPSSPSLILDTAELKKSNWYNDALHKITESEYEIKFDQESGLYKSANRDQNLRAFYTGNTFRLQPRNDSAGKWDLRLTTRGIYADEILMFQPDSIPRVIQDGNNIRFRQENNFITEYINSPAGIRQNFIIEKNPGVDAKTISVQLEVNEGWVINKVHAKEIHFAKAVADGLDKKLTYNQLKVWDAENKELEASFYVMDNIVSIEVNSDGAVYPLTIDPVSSTANTFLESNQSGAQLGAHLSSAGDVNGDGYSDVVIGVPLYANGQLGEGGAFIYHGSATGISSIPAIILESNLMGARFGNAVSTAGDVNGDGYGDIVIGANFYTNGQSIEGAAYIYYGSAGGIIATPAAILESNQVNAFMGQSVDCAGDVNGDGYSDVIVGIFNYGNGQTEEGAAFIFHGSAAGIIATPASILESNQAFAASGISVSGAGDVNGDGYSDVIVGVVLYDNGQTDEGAAFIYHGSPAGIMSAPAVILESNQAGAQMGRSVDCAGDVNGDGYSDVIVGARLYDNGQADEGAAFIYHGSATGIVPTPTHILESNQVNAQLGISVAAAGDVNGDGYSDIVLGAYLFDNGHTDEGATFLYYGSSTGVLTASPEIRECNQINSQFGIAVASAGDINGDGYSDMIVGAHLFDNGQVDEGAAFVYHGSAGNLAASPVLIDNITQDRASFALTIDGAGDVNADGFGDVIIGAPLFDDNGPDEGRAFVYYGSAAGLPATASVILDEANQAGAQFAFSVAGAGDVNGDGFSDVIVGAYQFNGFGRAYIYFGSAGGLSTTSNQQLDGTQAGEAFGVSVAGAGDVNRDGFSDVIIGSFSFDVAGRPDEGRAYVYHGSPAGVNTTPVSVLNDAGQPAAYFGRFVSSAGDVNGDGFSDVLVSAGNYDDGANTDEGAAFVYYGSCTGVSAIADRVLNDADEAGATFGYVSRAGDLNGDGYSDVVIGAIRANGQQGRVFVYYGSGTGLSAAPVILNNNLPNSSSGDWMGYSASIAGDVNGDGYGDLLVGVPQWENPGFEEQGRVFVYYGKPSGINTTPDRILADNPNNRQFFGVTVAGVGDINADGFSDVVIGGDHGSWPGYGIAYVYYGNDRLGLRNNLRLYNTDLNTPMNQSNINDPANFGAGLYSRSFLGRQKGLLVWETVSNATSFSGSPITNSVQNTSQQTAYTDLGLTGIELKANITKMPAPEITLTRARVKYDPVTALTGQVYGPWRYTAGYLLGKHEIPYLAMTTLELRLENDTLVCFPYTIDATVNGATNYTWQDGAIGPTYIATTSGTYWVDIDFGGCIYRDTVVLTAINPLFQNLTPRICQGQTYTAPSGNIYSSTGVFNDTLRSTGGCDSLIYTIDLAIQTNTTQTINANICDSQTYSLPWGAVVTAPGIYRDTLKYTSTNCDSIYRIVNLTVQTTITQITDANICAGQNYTLPWGTIVNTAGIYQDTLRYVSGCDSVRRIVNLPVQQPASSIIDAGICSGQTYTLPCGQVVSTAGIYHDTLYYLSGCDSLYRTVNLSIQTPQTDSNSVTICSGQSYTLTSGTVVSSAGIYRDTLFYTTGCDSLYRITNLTVQTTQTIVTTDTICAGQTYTLPWGTIVTVSGNYTDTLRYSTTGCDSLYNTVALTVLSSAITLSSNATICSGQSYTLPWGPVVTASGIYTDTIRFVSSGCDSLYTIVDLMVQSTQSYIVDTVICAGQSYTLPWGPAVTITGSYYDTLYYSSGCDSLYRTVNLTVQSPQTRTIDTTICQGQSYTLPSGIVAATTGVFNDTLYYSTGCDSLYTIVNLTVQNTQTILITDTICAGQTYTLPWAVNVTATGIYNDTLRYSATGCDSLYTIVDLTVQSSAISITTDAVICDGQTYTLPWGTAVNTTGVYTDTIRYAGSGCDSLYTTVNLLVQPAQAIQITDGICAGQTYTLPWGTVVAAPGIYRDTLFYTTGCDSLYRTVTLNVQSPQTQTLNAVICSSQTYTLPGGTVVSNTGSYNDTLYYNSGCDSLYTTVNLLVQSSQQVNIYDTICAGNSYTLPWGAVVNMPGIYSDTLRYNNTGCDSLFTVVNLFVLSSAQTITANASICAGQTYTLPWGTVVSATGTYTDTIRYISTGCDSLYQVVNLLVQSPQTSTTNATICDGQSYTLPWGTIANTTGTYRDTLYYSSGCDSLYRVINLTVQAASTIVLSPVICAGQTYMLPSGITVSSSGNYTDTARYASGCDSLYTIVNLTVLTIDSIVSNAAICAGQSYTLPWGVTVNSTGTYRDTLRYAQGCDSVYHIVNLVVQSPTTFIVNPAICAGQTYTLPWGTVVSTAGSYSDTLRYSNTGCDSLYRIINLTVQSVQVLPAADATICFGQNYILPSGTIVTTSGIYRDTLRYTQTNCDSIIRTINLTVQSPATQATNPVICQGQSYTLPWGAVVNTNGIYRDTLRYVETNCDSLYRIVSLSVIPAASSSLNASICQGDSYTLPWGVVVTTGGVYKDTLRSATGCDSLMRTINLTVNPRPVLTVSKSNDINCIIGSSNLSVSGASSYNWSPVESLSNAASSNPIATPTATTVYTVQATSSNGCVSSGNITVFVDNSNGDNGFQLPSAFTPNGDGKNDCFGVRTWGNVSNLKLHIYNRWGQLVFATTDPSRCWDGTFKGKQESTAVFVYQVSAETNCGPVYRKGTVTLIR